MRKKSAPRKGGRPTEKAAEQIRDTILDAATELFLAEGYGAVSIEAIARRAGISKRTFYSRFDDKAALFAAVVERLIARMRPGDVSVLFMGDDLEEILIRLSKFILVAAVSREAVALHRLMVSEAARFPEIMAAMEREGSRAEAIERISDLLRRHLPNMKLGANFAAEQFLQLCTARPQMRSLSGHPMTVLECSQWAEDTVRLFLRGVRE